MQQSSSIKSELIEKLKQEHCFWSYGEFDVKDISDDMLIEKALVYLDIAEIYQLFQIYSFAKVKKVWKEQLIPQAEYLYALNRFLAWYYFKVKKPDIYLKSMTTRYYNRLPV